MDPFEKPTLTFWVPLPFAQISALGAGNKSFLGLTNPGTSKMSQGLLFPNHPNRSGYALKYR